MRCLKTAGENKAAHKAEGKQKKESFCTLHGTCANPNEHEQTRAPCLMKKRNLFVNVILGNSMSSQ